MKKLRTILTVVTFMFLMGLFTGCQESQKTAQAAAADPAVVAAVAKPDKAAAETPPRLQTKGKPPAIVVENPVHDFGEIGPGKSFKCQFNFKNTGDGILKISKIKTTCGCTVAKLKKKKYAPGESGTVEVTFRAPKNQGPTSKHLYILSNDRKDPKLELTIKAAVQLVVAVEPAKLKLSLRAENAGIEPITLTSKDGTPFSIKSFTTFG